MEPRRIPRDRQKRRRRLRRLALVLSGVLALAWLLALAGFAPGDEKPPVAHEPHVHDLLPRLAVPARPPQFVVVSFDGSGGDRLWPYWRSVARRAHAHFTFFVSGVYLLDEARRTRYHPPRHKPGRSDIGFAQPEGSRSARAVVRATLRQIALGYLEGHEIGTHFNGHFCAPYSGSVGAWSSADWSHELDEFDRLLFHASANNGLRPRVRLPFGPSEIVGDRTPCLEGNLHALYPLLARRGFRYDASQIAVLGEWPRRELGIWSVPLLEIPFVGHTFKVVSMDYNFLANQIGTTATVVEEETYASLWHAFRASYVGNRAPLSVGVHFETWNGWAYDHAVARFLVRACRLPEVRCASIRELVDWLDAQPPRRLRRNRAGRFPRFRAAAGAQASRGTGRSG